MNRLFEQRYAIMFCFKLGKTASETHAMIKSAYGVDAMGRLSVFEWHKLFREGREQVEDDKRSGRPSSSKSSENLVKVKNVLSSDRRLSVRMIFKLLNLPKSTVHEIVTENLGSILRDSAWKTAKTSRSRPPRNRRFVEAPPRATPLSQSWTTWLNTVFQLPTLPQPPYSPDAAPPDFLLFPRPENRISVLCPDSNGFWKDGTTAWSRSFKRPWRVS